MERVDYESLIISDLLGFNSSKQLNITPWYQRRAVWTAPQKAYLINTIFERKPVPSIYIRQLIDIETERTMKEVVDGQQRVRTIVGYRNDEFAAKHPAHRGRVKYSELSNAQKTGFLSTPLSVGYLIGATDQDVIEIFGRINSVSKTLNPMEKINAQFSGEFKQFCLSQAAMRLPFWRSTNMFTSNEIARMQEVQFFSDLVINLMDGLSDYDPKKIKEYYERFDEEFPREEEIASRVEVLFQRLAALDPESFSGTVFRSAQVSFSLMLFLDSRREAMPGIDEIHTAITEIDAAATSAIDGETGTDPRYIEGFGSGNLHRIRSRRTRHEILEEAFG